MKNILLIFSIISFMLPSFAINLPNEERPDDIHWTGWSESIFKQAKKENKFIILDLEAIWCHWCHVMRKTTYSDPAVQNLLKSKYITVRVDQDSRPDLANRYREYGWPATIFFNSKGEEIVKRSGYIQPENMRMLLQKIIDEPSPEETQIDDEDILFSSAQTFTDELKTELIENHLSTYDLKTGGLDIPQKFLDSDSIEYCLIEAKTGNKKEEEMAKKTLNASLALIDPVWGGAYQYSTMGGWNYPHFEKLANIQARYIRIYSQAYSIWKEPKYLKAAEDVYKYIKSFLMSPKGVFYVSQDADIIQGEHGSEYFMLSDSERRKIGIPRIDTHVYSSQNGLLIDALVNLYNATGKKEYLNEAINAAEWIVRYRVINPKIADSLQWIFGDFSTDVILERLKWVLSNISWTERGFRHDEKDLAGPFLNDTLNMGKAFISLYNTTNDKKWLIRSEQAARFIDRHFTSPVVGFATSEASCKVCAVRAPSRLIDENIEIVRFTSKLYQRTKYISYKEMAEHAMKYIATPEIATRTLTEPGILIANLELNEANK